MAQSSGARCMLRPSRHVLQMRGRTARQSANRRTHDRPRCHEIGARRFHRLADVARNDRVGQPRDAASALRRAPAREAQASAHRTGRISRRRMCQRPARRSSPRRTSAARHRPAARHARSISVHRRARFRSAGAIRRTETLARSATPKAVISAPMKARIAGELDVHRAACEGALEHDRPLRQPFERSRRPRRARGTSAPPASLRTDTTAQHPES